MTPTPDPAVCNVEPAFSQHEYAVDYCETHDQPADQCRPDPAVAALAAALHAYYHNGEGSADGGHDGATVFCSEDAPAILAALRADTTAARAVGEHIWPSMYDPNDPSYRALYERLLRQAAEEGGALRAENERLRAIEKAALVIVAVDPEADEVPDEDWAPEFLALRAALDAAPSELGDEAPVAKCQTCGADEDEGCGHFAFLATPDAARQSLPDSGLAGLVGAFLHQKGIGCDGHRGDDRDVSFVMHTDDAHDVLTFLRGVSVTPAGTPVFCECRGGGMVYPSEHDPRCLHRLDTPIPDAERLREAINEADIRCEACGDPVEACIRPIVDLEVVLALATSAKEAHSGR